MLDLNGFVTSTEFLAQLVSIITAIITAFLGTFLTGALGATGSP